MGLKCWTEGDGEPWLVWEQGRAKIKLDQKPETLKEGQAELCGWAKHVLFRWDNR